MSKTPEQLAEEYAFKFYLNEDSGYSFTMNKDAFLAGYNAAAPKWISVKERLPEFDRWCTWWDVRGCTEPCTAFRDINDFEFWWENYTHWMPLPAPPPNERE